MAKDPEVVDVWTDGKMMRLEFDDGSWSWDPIIKIFYEPKTGLVYVTQEDLCACVQGTTLVPAPLPNEVVELTGWTRGAIAMALGDWLTIRQEIKELRAQNS